MSGKIAGTIYLLASAQDLYVYAQSLPFSYTNTLSCTTFSSATTAGSLCNCQASFAIAVG